MPASVRRRVIAAVLVAMMVPFGGWLSSPVGPTPGEPLRMFNPDGTDLKVAALTFSEGPDRRWRHLSDPTMRTIPPRWLYALDTFRMGTGQDQAHAAGYDAAAFILGDTSLVKPVGVYPGEVSGTSSGLAWALATLLLNDPTLVSDGVVYATGALHSSEGVAAINGLSTKLSTPGLREARVVFVPASQYQVALDILHERGETEIARRVFGVDHVSDALAVLCRTTPDARTCAQRI